MDVEQPYGLTPCDCSGTTGSVCVKGDDALYAGLLARMIYAMIYQPPDGPSNPGDGPPGGCATCVPKADGTWCIGYVSGAACAASPTPAPQNQIWVWAEFSDPDLGIYYVIVSQPFQGQCQADLPPCCPSSSSSSFELVE